MVPESKKRHLLDAQTLRLEETRATAVPAIKNIGGTDTHTFGPLV